MKMFENAIQNRYEFVILYDVENGNPNGDPDAGNMPRIDPETGYGIVTDVCIKRKIRNYVDLVNDGRKGFDIYIRQDAPLNVKDAETAEEVKNDPNKDRLFQEKMCQKYYDIRTFGAVMTIAGKKGQDVKLKNTAGQVRGPVQLAFGRSVDPIRSVRISTTRMAVTKSEDFYDKNKTNTFAPKHIVPYGLYRQEGFISANLAQKVTGFSEGDLELLWQAIEHMFEEDRSAARGKMTLRELIIFKHDSKLGNAPSHKLFELVEVKRRDGVETPRAYSDYIVSVGEPSQGVTIERRG
jgi:CRISPR-associated protein Csd2